MFIPSVNIVVRLVDLLATTAVVFRVVHKASSIDAAPMSSGKLAELTGLACSVAEPWAYPLPGSTDGVGPKSVSMVTVFMRDSNWFMLSISSACGRLSPLRI